MENESVFEKIRSLGLNAGEYVVVSGGVLEAHGIRQAHDLDLVVTQEIYDRLLEEGWQIRAGVDNTILLFKDNVEVATDWSYKEYQPDPKDLIMNADTIEGCSFVKLEEVLKLKKAMNRQKDIEDIELIEKWLNESNH